MSYKNDSYLVIANKFGSASGDAKAMLWETYDQLRDLTVSGNGLGSGFGMTGGFFSKFISSFIFCYGFWSFRNHEYPRNFLCFKI